MSESKGLTERQRTILEVIREAHHRTQEILDAKLVVDEEVVPGKPTMAEGRIALHLMQKLVNAAQLNDPMLKTLSVPLTSNFSGDDILDMLCKMPRTAEFITHKMWSFFAYRNPEPELIQRLAGEFHRSSLDIKTLLRAMMTAPEFYSDKAHRSIYKNPVDFALTTARQLGLGALVAESTPQSGAGVRRLGPVVQINQAMKGMGMQLMYPPDVAGWDQGQAWITTATMVERIGWADRLFGSQRVLIPFDTYSLFAGDPTPIGVARTLVSIFDAPLPESKVEALIAAAEKACEGRLTSANARETARAVCRLIFAAPEFQFC